MAKEDSTSGSGAAPKKKLPIQKIMAVGFVVLNLAGTLGGAALVYLATLSMDRPSITEETAVKERESKQNGEEVVGGVTYTMDPFTVNLDGHPKRTMRTVITLEMLDNRGFEEVVNLGAGARDSIARLLNSKSFSELESVQGKLFLKDEITTHLNHYLKAGVVKNVYFSEFVAQ